MLSLSDDDHSQARRLSLHYLETRADPENSSPSLVYQFSHRLALVQFWEVLPGSRVLEIGCGQGDTTIVLANAVGPDGHVDAIDPGDPDYGKRFHFNLPTCKNLTGYRRPSYTVGLSKLYLGITIRQRDYLPQHQSAIVPRFIRWFTLRLCCILPLHILLLLALHPRLHHHLALR